MIITAVVLVFSNVLNAHNQEDFSFMDKLRTLELNSEGHIGIYAVNTLNDYIIEYRANEIFPTGCTSKVIGVSAVLKKSMSDPFLLSKNIKYSEEDLEEWSPITRKYVSIGITINDLCAASISFSDNTAMNLLLKIIGGVQGMNEFARSMGDLSFRQDNDWPNEAFSGGLDNVKDSSTPKSMVESFRKLTLGEVLDSPRKDLLINWLINTNLGTFRIRSATPKSWIVGNKTGTGLTYGSTNDLAIIWPPNHAPILIGIYYTTINKHAKKREDIVASIAKILIEEFMHNDQTLI